MLSFPFPANPPGRQASQPTSWAQIELAAIAHSSPPRAPGSIDLAICHPMARLIAIAVGRWTDLPAAGRRADSELEDLHEET